MRGKSFVILALAVITTSILLGGCSGGDDSQYVDKAPPAKEGAEAVTPPTNKVRMGATGASGMGAAPVAGGENQPMAKPPGM